ncbi:hypothetical protein I6E29_01375 [Arcanobacterium haemolyticum]|nr:hypothetical protein [Arcanobacterium haemolyticum]
MKTLRAISAIVACGCVAGAAYVVAALPAPDLSPAEPIMADTESNTANLVCPGGFVSALAGDGEAAAQPSAEGDQPATAWIAGSTTNDLTLGSTTITPASGTVFYGSGEPLNGLLTARASGSSLPVSAGSLHTSSSGDTRGSAMSLCQSPTNDLWLIGSQSGVGTSNQLVLTNPSKVAISVSVKAYGSTGALDLGSLSTVSVGAGETVRTSLDGALSSDASLAFHIQADAGTVGAWIEESVLNGAKPSGVTTIGATNLATNLTIPGVAQAGTAPVLRIVAGEADASVSPTLVGPSGRRTLESIDVPAGTVHDLPLTDLEPGHYTLDISADNPIGASVLIASADQSAVRDIAWAPAIDPVSAGAVVFGELPATFVAWANGSQTIKVTPLASDGTPGEPIALDITHGQGSAALPEGTVGALVSSPSPVYAAVVTTGGMEDGTALDWIPVTAARTTGAAHAITIGR